MVVGFGIEEIKRAAAGREIEILVAVAGIPREVLDGRHHPCPHPACRDHGGRDRFRLIDAAAGAVYCNQCFNTKNGDFLAAIQWFCGCSLKEALAMVAQYLGLDAEPPAKKQSRAPNGLRIVDWDEGAAKGWCAIKPPILPEALLAIGTQQAIHHGRYPVLCFPIWGSAAESEQPVGHALVDQRGGLLPAFDRDGNKTGDVKIKTSAGSKAGWIGQVDRLKDAKVVWKVEGPSDVLALISMGLPEDHAAITNAMGANENPRPALLRPLAGKEVVLVHDADVPGEQGAAKWQAGLLTVAAPLKRIQLPYEIAEKGGKDVRDFLFEHGAEGIAKLLGLAKVVEPDGNAILRNYRKEESPDGEPVYVGLEAAEIVEDLKRLGGHDLRSVDVGPGGMLFAHGLGESVSTLERLPDADSLFAWISRATGRPADWARRSNCLTKAEFLKAAPRNVPSHSWIESAPQWPTMLGVYYACGTVEPEANGWLDELVNVFYFDDDLDRCFAKAALLTPFLGVYGDKPLGYVTSPDGQGAGKTQFVETIGYLIGEPIVKFTGGLPKDKEREEAFTNPATFRSRVALFDNVEKDRTLKSGDIESILTAKTIEGRTLYVGPTSRKNNLAYFLTTNYVQVSRDFAQRLYRVSIRRRPEGVDVGKQAAGLIDAHRPELLRDIAAFFARRPAELNRGTRWTTWTDGIVARFGESADAMVERLLEDQREVDGDAQVGDEIESAVLDALTGQGLDPLVVKAYVSHAFLGRVLGLPSDAPTDRRRITSAMRGALMGRNLDDGGFRLGDRGSIRLDKSRTTNESSRSQMVAGWFYEGTEHDGRRTETLE